MTMTFADLVAAPALAGLYDTLAARGHGVTLYQRSGSGGAEITVAAAAATAAAHDVPLIVVARACEQPYLREFLATCPTPEANLRMLTPQRLLRPGVTAAVTSWPGYVLSVNWRTYPRSARARTRGELDRLDASAGHRFFAANTTHVEPAQMPDLPWCTDLHVIDLHAHHDTVDVTCRSIPAAELLARRDERIATEQAAWRQQLRSYRAVRPPR